MLKMPEDFPAWYATVEAAPDGKANSRWEGVVNALKKPQADEVEVLIRLALGTRQRPDQAVLNRILENIRAGDQTWDTSASAREIQILAASALVARLIPSSIVAMALTTAGLDGARKPELPMDLFNMAENAVRQKAKTSRTRQDLGQVIATKSEWFSTSDQLANMSMQAMGDELQKIFDEALDHSAQCINDVIKIMERRLDIADEELQMLWWLIGGEMSSGGAISDLSLSSRPLAIGRELGERTVMRPGPIAIPALLSRAGLSRTTKIKVIDAINSMSEAWSNETMEGLSVSPVTHPIHEAIRRRN